MPTTMANQRVKEPTVDLQALLTRAKNMPIDTTPMPTIKPSLADSLHTLQSQVAQIMTVQLEKFEEIVGVVNSMKQGYKQLDSKVEKVQAEMKVLKEKLAENKVDKIQAEQMALQGRLEEVASSLKKLEEGQESDDDSDEHSESDELEEVDTNPGGNKSKTDSTGTQPIGETARYVSKFISLFLPGYLNLLLFLSTAIRTDESDKKSRETVLSPNKRCNPRRDKKSTHF